MGPCNGTQQWHHVHSPKVGRHPPPPTTPRPPPQSWSSPPNHSTLQWHPAMAPRPTAPCNVTLLPRPIRQSGSSPSPLLEVRTPIAIAIWGTKITKRALECYISWMIENIECAEFWLRFIPMFSLLRRGHESRNVLHHGLQCFLHECGNCRWALARDTWIFGRGRWGEWLLMLRWTRFQLLVLGMFFLEKTCILGQTTTTLGPSHKMGIS